MKRVVARESQIVGTYDDETLLALLNGGTLKLGDQYWHPTTSSWRPLTDFIGAQNPARRFGPALKRLAALFLVAGCGSLATWWTLKDSVGVPTVVGQPGASEPPKAGTPTKAHAPVLGPTLAPAISPAEEKTSASALAILNVEVFDEEVAVTVQNNGPEPVNRFDLKLKYFVLPGDQLVFDSNETAIAEQETARLAAAAKAKEWDARVGELELHLKRISTDVAMWTPADIKALPSSAQWSAFGDTELSDAGTALLQAAADFAASVSSSEPVARDKALTELLPDLARRTEQLKIRIKRAIQRTTTARNRLATDQSVADEALGKLRRRQDELQPRLADLLAEARKKTIRTEIVHVEALIEPDLVHRHIVKREKNDRHGVVVELAKPEDKTVALSDPR